MRSSVSSRESGEAPRGFSRRTRFAWPLVRARDIVQLHYGKALVAQNRGDGAIPVYGTNGRSGWTDVPLRNGPGVILGRKGMGNLGVEWSEGPYWVIDTAYYAEPLTEDLDLKYLYYLTKYIGLNHLKDGTSNPGLTRDAFGAQFLPFPPPAEQRAIASVLGTLDDKIHLNRRMNQTLEQLAGAIFKSWFTDFDPVRAKAEGREPFGMDAAIGDLFPASFDDSELGKIPTGWRVCRLRSVTSYLSRGTGPDYSHEGILVLGQKCVRDHRVDLLLGRRHSLSRKPINGRELHSGDVLVNSTGVGTLGRVARLGPLREPAIVDSHVTVLRADGVNMLPTALALLIQSIEGEIEALGEGSTGQTELSRERLGSLAIVVPPVPLQARLDAIVAPIFGRMDANQEQSRTLANLRDTLLPKLLSGEILVKPPSKRSPLSCNLTS